MQKKKCCVSGVYSQATISLNDTSISVLLMTAIHKCGLLWLHTDINLDKTPQRATTSKWYPELSSAVFREFVHHGMGW